MFDNHETEQNEWLDSFTLAIHSKNVEVLIIQVFNISIAIVGQIVCFLLVQMYNNLNSVCLKS